MPDDPRPELAARDEAIAQELRDMATFLINVEHDPADRPGLRYAAWLLYARADGIMPLPADDTGHAAPDPECTHGGDCPLPGHPNALHGHIEGTDWAGHMRAGSARMLAIDAGIRAAGGHLGRAASRVSDYPPPGCQYPCMYPAGPHGKGCWSARPVSNCCPPCADCRQPPRIAADGSAVLRHADGCPQLARDDDANER